MAAGDVFDTVITSVANNGFLDVRPPAGEEAVVHNIYYAGAVELYKSDGTNQILFDSDSPGPSAVLSAAIHVTNTRYLRVRNVSGAAALFHADGIKTK